MSTPKNKKTSKNDVAQSEFIGVPAQPVSRVQWVSRESLRANDYNPNAVAPIEMNLLALSIREDGWTQPIVAHPDGTIVDGFHRYTVSSRPEIFAMTGGMVPVVFLDKERGDRMLSTIRHNRARGVHGVRPMAGIVRELIEQGYEREAIMVRLGMESEEVERLYDQAGMPEKIARGRNGFNAGWTPKASE
jgi:ParB-like chromosome segregation protein Spo0J